MIQGTCMGLRIPRDWLRIAVFLGMLLATASSLPARTWTDRQGRSVQGKFVRMHEGKVVLLAHGRAMTVAFSDLSDADQQYLRGELRKQGKESELPPEIAAPAVGPSSPSVPDAGTTTNVTGTEERVWTDNQGRKITARFVRREGVSIVLQMNGQEFTVPLHTLSFADQQYAMQAIAATAMRDAQERRDGQGGTPSGMGATPSGPSFPPAGAPGPSFPGPAFPGPNFPKPPDMATVGPSGSSQGGQATEDEPWVDDYRQWQLPGSRTLQATLHRLKAGGFLTLREQDGQKTDVLFQDLNDQDQQYTRQRMTEIGKSYMLPPPNSTQPPPTQVAQAPRDTASAGPSFVPPPSSSAPPSIRPPSSPSPPDFSGPPRSEDEIDGYCSNCDAPIPASIGAGDKCPQCGVFFEYEEDEYGREHHYSEQSNLDATAQANVREFEQEQSSSSSFRLRGRSVRGIVWLVIFVGSMAISLAGWLGRKVLGS